MMSAELDGRRTYTYLDGRETGRSPPEGLLEALVKNGTVREGSTILWRLYEQINVTYEKNKLTVSEELSASSTRHSKSLSRVLSEKDVHRHNGTKHGVSGLLSLRVALAIVHNGVKVDLHVLSRLDDGPESSPIVSGDNAVLDKTNDDLELSRIVRY